MAETILVVNLKEINRSLTRCGPLVYKAMSHGLREAAIPVKRDADRLSVEKIPGMKRAKKSPPPWSVQKIGQNRAEVYIRPTQKGLRGRKTEGQQRRADKFVELMYGRAYNPALEKNQGLVRETVDVWLSKVIREV